MYAQLRCNLFATKFLVHYGNILTGNPLMGTSNAGGMKKSQSLINISLCLGTDTRSGHCGMRIGSYTQVSNGITFNDPERPLTHISR